MPPHDAEAECAVLGALLLGASPADADEAFSALQPDSFYRQAHAEIFAACREIHNERSEIDEVTVGNKLRAQGSTVKAAVVAALTESTPTAANLGHYVRIVREHAMRRKLIAVATSAAKAAEDLSTPVADMLDDVAEKVSQITTSQSRTEIWDMSTLVREQYRKLQAQADGPDETTGTPTGFYDLDDKLGGLEPGQFILLAGRPSMGKTSFATAVCENVAIKSDKHVLFVSIEMERESLVRRSIASHARVDGQKIRRPRKLDSAEWSRIAEACQKLDTQNFHGVDTAKLTVIEIRAIARQIQARHGSIGLVAVDYLGLIRPVHRYPNAREREVAEISSGLKSLAKELSVPVLCLAQLNRDVEKRNEKRPRLSDLRESGSLEQDADVVLFVHREGYFNPKHDDIDAEIIIAKQRNGAVGTAHVGWDGKSTKFFNIAQTGRLF